LSKAQSVTSLEVSPEVERRNRFIKYTVAMIIRVVCVVLAVIVPLGWLTILFAAGAVFLPYFAVVIANAQGTNSSSSSRKTAEAPTISISADSFRNAKSDDKNK
jgi:endonuclease/exonuclease/phosphatase (EEP) superfamily protein YafD